jgi:hypothetical protein
MRLNAKAILTLVIGSLIVSAAWFSPADAGMRVGFTYATQPADIRVWLEAGDGYHGDSYYEDRGYDVYPSVDDVVLYVRTSRSCYAAVYVVDTAGFIHVVYPLSPFDNTYLRGGRVYSFYLSDLDLSGAFGRGVAYAFAVSSPVSFTYRYYGWGVFRANFGFQIYGDPYVAARSFYLSLIPGSCRREVIGISHARFYVREYVRYPSYLCAGWHDYYGVRSYCRANCAVYKDYSVHAKDPYRALHPTRRLRPTAVSYTEIVRTEKWREGPRVRSHKSAVERDGKPVAYERHAAKMKPAEKGDTRNKAVRKTHVVKSSRNSFVQSKKDISTMRQELERRKTVERSSSAKLSKSNDRRIRKESRTAVTQKRASQRDTKVKQVAKKTQQVTRADNKSSKQSSQKKSVKKTSRDDKSNKAKSSGKERHGKR